MKKASTSGDDPAVVPDVRHQELHKHCVEGQGGSAGPVLALCEGGGPLPQAPMQPLELSCCSCHIDNATTPSRQTCNPMPALQLFKTCSMNQHSIPCYNHDTHSPALALNPGGEAACAHGGGDDAPWSPSRCRPAPCPRPRPCGRWPWLSAAAASCCLPSQAQREGGRVPVALLWGEAGGPTGCSVAPSLRTFRRAPVAGADAAGGPLGLPAICGCGECPTHWVGMCTRRSTWRNQARLRSCR